MRWVQCAWMWAYYVTEQSKNRTPTGAEPDRIAGTNNYGRRVLPRWKQHGKTAEVSNQGRRFATAVP